MRVGTIAGKNPVICVLMNTKVIDYWWEGDDLILVTEEGTYRLVNAYLKDIRFKGLDFDETEECIL